MVIRNSVPELAERCTRLIDRENYGFFYDPVEQLMMHGYYVNLPGRSEYSYGLLYTESRLGSLIAIGKGRGTGGALVPHGAPSRATSTGSRNRPRAVPSRP